MANQSEFVAQDRMATSDGDQLETAGQAILKLLHKAAISFRISFRAFHP